MEYLLANSTVQNIPKVKIINPRGKSHYIIKDRLLILTQDASLNVGCYTSLKGTKFGNISSISYQAKMDKNIILTL